MRNCLTPQRRCGDRNRTIQSTFIAAFLMISSCTAMADHIHFQNVRINNVPLANEDGDTNPTITVPAGQNIVISAEGVGDPDPTGLVFTFSKDSGTLDAPADETVNFAGGGPTTLSITRSYTLAGTFTGTLTLDFPDSSPDYIDPAGNFSDDTHTFSFTIVIAGTEIAGLVDQTISEDTSLTVNFSIGNAAVDLSKIVLSASSSNKILVPDNAITFGGSGASRTLTVTPAANQKGKTTISVMADDGIFKITRSFVLTVKDDNVAPVVTGLINQTTSPATPITIPFTVSDDRTPAANLQFTLMSVNTALIPNANLVLGGSGNDRTLTITPAAGKQGKSAITVIVTDAGEPDNQPAQTVVSFVVNVGSAIETFRILSLGTTNADIIDHDSITGDDKGGIAISATSVLINGDSETGVANASNLSGLVASPVYHDSLCSDLKTEIAYGLASGDTEISATGGVFALDTLLEIGADGNYTGNKIALSSPITIDQNGVSDAGDIGIFSGYGIIVIHNRVNAYLIELPSGNVTDLGAMNIPNHEDSENYAYWGTAEYFDNKFYIDYRVSGAAEIVRTEIPSGTTTTISSFSNLNDLASFTFSPSRNRWYFHHESGSQFGGSSETLGYADATWDQPVNPPLVDNPPVISRLINRTIVENTVLGPVSFFVTDAETPNALTVSATSTDQTLLPDANIVIGGTGNNLTITATPATNQTGAAAIRIKVDDGTNQTVASFTLTVVDDNTAPTIQAFANQTVTDDTVAGPYTITVGDAETSADNLVVTATSSDQSIVPDANIVVGGTGTQRTITITPVADQRGLVTITVSVADDGTPDMNVLSSSMTFDIQFVEDNTQPTISGVSNQTGIQDLPVGPINVVIGDAETPVANLTLVGTSNNQTIVPDANIVVAGTGANRTITVTPAAGQTGTVTITLTVSDDGAPDTTPFTNTTSFDVTFNADAGTPIISSIQDQTIVEDTVLGPISFGVNDVSTLASDLVLTGTSDDQTLVPDAAIVFGGSGTDRTVTITPAANKNGTANITITVTDESSNFASMTFKLTVLEDNSAPVILGTSQINVVGSGTASMSFIVNDAESPVADLVVKAVSLNQLLVPNNGLVIEGTGTSRTLNLTAFANAGSGIVRISVTDVGDEPPLTTTVDVPVTVYGTPAIYYLNAEAVKASGDDDNVTQMDRVFGSTGWQNLTYETAEATLLFAPSTSFVFLDGTGLSGDGLQSFLSTNSTLIQSWVNEGGRLFINAGITSGGFDAGFGALVVAPAIGLTSNAVDVNHPIFSGPFLPCATSFGNFGTAAISGNGFSSLVVDADVGFSILAEKAVGSGFVVLGGMKQGNLSNPQPEASNLRANIIAYAASKLGSTPPQVAATIVAAQEGSPVTLNGTITDPDTLQSFTVTINWGDNSQTTLPVAAGTNTFSTTHTYVDDNQADSYSVVVTVKDSDGGVGSVTTAATVTNAVPQVAISIGGASNGSLTFTSVVSDAGTADTFTYSWVATIAGNQVAVGDQSTFTFTAPAEGQLVVSLNVTDDDGGVGSASISSPVVTSGLTVLANVITAGSPVVFVVGSSGGTVTWDFGDGTTGTGSTVSHSFSPAGTYTVKATITGANGVTTVLTQTITVSAATAGGQLDSDGDGFSDAMEVAAGSDPLSSASSPLTNGSPEDPIPLPDVKLAIKLAFGGVQNKDSIKLSGTLLAGEGYSPAGQKLLVDIGGVAASFTLDAKGSAKTATGSAKVSVKAAKSGVTPAQTAKFAVSLKGTFSAALADEGLVGTASVKSKAVTVGISVVFDNQLFTATKNMLYSASANKSGGAK